MPNIAVFASGEGTTLEALINSEKTGGLHGTIKLVVSTVKTAGALERAQKHNIEAVFVDPAEFASPGKFDEYLAELCKKRGIDLVCLAGYLRMIGPAMLKEFRNRILNIHPALLPAFGGKGFYGGKVHEAVLAHGAKVSGCTVHFVNSEYDSGPVLLQDTVPVYPGDTPAALAERVHEKERFLYPKAVGLFCRGLVKISGGKAEIIAGPTKRISRALLSVSDKAGVAEFARELAACGVELVSTSGTAKQLAAAGVPVRPLETLTGFAEILGGRVKTLHPAVHGGILFKRGEHAGEARKLGLEALDIVIVNLYPFSGTLARHKGELNGEVVEQIDIGGVALIRAASKNYEDVVILTDPADYAAVLKQLRENGDVDATTRKRLAAKGFSHTAAYDAAISAAFGKAAEPGGGGIGALFPEKMDLELHKLQDMRYGENPHQKAALYSPGKASSFTQLHGKELSYNNILDVAGTWRAVNDFEEPAAVIFKHVTPSGIAIGKNIEEAFKRAWASDPVSAFGGVIAVNRKLTAKTAVMIAEFFVEVVNAPDYDEEAVEILSRKKNIRIIKHGQWRPTRLSFLTAGGEMLVSEPDNAVSGPEWKTATKRAPTKAEYAALKFAWAAAKPVRSNAIVLADETATVGIGAGQMSRIDSVALAGIKYTAYLKNNLPASVLVMASDAFFPFKDSVQKAAELGVTAIVQPGGSIKDGESIEEADRHDISMMLTGMRHFRH